MVEDRTRRHGRQSCDKEEGLVNGLRVFGVYTILSENQKKSGNNRLALCQFDKDVNSQLAATRGLRLYGYQ